MTTGTWREADVYRNAARSERVERTFTIEADVCNEIKTALVIILCAYTCNTHYVHDE